MRELLLVMALAGCSGRQAPKARLAGEVMSLAGVGSMIGGALGGGPTGEVIVGTGSLVTLTGILLYAWGELGAPEVVYKQETLPQRHHRWAVILSQRASGAARENRCARVRRLEHRIDQYDRAVHDTMLMADPEVVRCLNAAAGTSLAPDVAPAVEAPHADEGLPPTILPKF